MSSDRFSIPALLSGGACLQARRLRFFLALACVLALLAPALFAGEKAAGKKSQRYEFALIFGTVWSASDQSAPGVTVKIRRADDKKARWTLVSDRRGEFAQRVPVGPADYIVWAELPKHKAPVAETSVHIDSNERADIGLHLPKL